MDPNLRSWLLGAAIAFCGLFALLTIAVVIENGIDIFSLTAIAVLALLLPALIGALRNPPE